MPQFRPHTYLCRRWQRSKSAKGERSYHHGLWLGYHYYKASHRSHCKKRTAGEAIKYLLPHLQYWGRERDIQPPFGEEAHWCDVHKIWSSRNYWEAQIGRHGSIDRNGRRDEDTHVYLQQQMSNKKQISNTDVRNEMTRTIFFLLTRRFDVRRCEPNVSF